ncbi:NUDIX domain-containing protein [Patescibacteria group bacterium]|nr:NUDIX domain-containing protein [Patescibacteria group bacterium]
MSDESRRAKLFGLDKTVARLAVLVSEKHPRTNESHLVTGLVQRPYWSKQGASEWSMMGGRPNDKDFNVLAKPDLTRQLTPAEVEAVTRQTAVRKAHEEVGLLVRANELNYMGMFQNGPWATALFYMLRGQRPNITLAARDLPLEELDGFQWTELNAALKGIQIFADHGIMLQEVMDEVLGVGAAD